MLRDTAGEKGYKQTDEMSFSTLPSLRATSPIFCVTKHRGGVLNVSDCETEILYKAMGTGKGGLKFRFNGDMHISCVLNVDFLIIA